MHWQFDRHDAIRTFDEGPNSRLECGVDVGRFVGPSRDAFAVANRP
jgi:hypothetical protein